MGKHTSRPRDEVIRRILANAALPDGLRSSSHKIAEDVGVPVSYIYDCTGTLRRKGLLPTSKAHPWPNVAGGGSAGGGIRPERLMSSKTGNSLDFDKLLADVAEGKIVSLEQRKFVLTQVIAFGADLAKIRAIQLMNDIENAGSRNIGPPAPANDDEMFTRLSRVLLSAPRALATRVIEHWRNHVEVETSQESPPSERLDPGDNSLAGRSGGPEL